MPGSPTSSTTMSGRHESARCTASMPLWTTATVWPSVRNSIARLSAASTLSSTTRMRTGNRRTGTGAAAAATAASAPARAGSRMANALPRPSPSLWADTCPWCSSTIFFTSVSPMPSPPRDRSSDRSACTNGSNTRVSTSGAMPAPLSRISITTASSARGEVNRRAGVGELAGVVQQIGDHLRESHGIALHGHGLFGQAHHQLLPLRVDERARRLDGDRDRVANLQRLTPQFHLAAEHARHVEQIVHHAHQVLYLTVDHRVQPLPLGIGLAAHL